MQNRICGLLIVIALASGCGSPATAPTPAAPSAVPPSSEKAAELRWAREVAESFLRAIVSRDFAGAIQLTTPAYQDRYKQSADGEGAARYRLEHRVYGREFCPPADQEKTPTGPEWEAVRFAEWTMDSEAIAPGKDEAVIKGSLSGPTRKAAYALCVVKDGGKWRVETFSVPGPQK